MAFTTAEARSDRERDPEPGRETRAASDHSAGAGPALHLARYIDHTLLRPEATAEEIKRLCREALEYGFAAACVNPSYTALASSLLAGSGVKVCTVIAFPLGALTPADKAAEARNAVAAGAQELDMVLNLGALKGGDLDLVRRDIRAVVEAAAGCTVKVILETGLLTPEEKRTAALLAQEAGAHFVKTCTGFGPGKATPEEVRFLRQVVGPAMGIKASGGIRDRSAAEELLAAGADRLGTSAGPAIVAG